MTILTPAIAGLQSALEAVHVNPRETIVMVDQDQWSALLAAFAAEGERVQPGNVVRFDKITFRMAP